MRAGEDVEGARHGERGDVAGRHGVVRGRRVELGDEPLIDLGRPPVDPQVVVLVQPGDVQAAPGGEVGAEGFAPERWTAGDVAEVLAAAPDAIVLITFEEILQVAPALINANLGPAVQPWYFVDGNLSNYGDDFPAGTLEGVKGTLPGAETTSEFQERLLEVDPTLRDFAYAPESYDATILVALAAVAANTDDTVAIKDAMVSVSKDGTKCETFADCKDLLLAGEDIDYDGVSGPVGIAISNDGKTLFVANGEARQLVAVDVDRQTVKAAFALDFQPTQLERSGGFFLLASGTPGSLPAQVLDAERMQVFFVPVSLGPVSAPATDTSASILE